MRLAGASAVGTAALGGGGLLYAHEVEPDWPDVAHVGLNLPHLAAGFQGYRVVQFSDIHVDGWMLDGYLDTVARLVNEQQPDLVAVTGDFVTSSDGSPEPYGSPLVEFLRRLRAADGAVGVLGNHDHWADPALVRHVMREGGVVDVSNGVHTLRRGDSALYVAGVDDVWEGRDRLDLVLARLPPAGAAILLAHEPDFADSSAATGRFGLQLSGHSHGGQVRLPLVGPPLLPRFARKYPAGRYQVGGMVQYTNRGLGTLGPRVRLNCRPEITVFELEAQT